MPKTTTLIRPYWALVALFAIIRLAMGARGAEYAAVTDKFSIVTLSLISSALTAALSRGLIGASWKNAAQTGAMIGISGQLVIFVLTIGSVLLGAQTFFNHPLALNQPAGTEITLGLALTSRVFGLVVNTILNVIAASIGWAIGGLMGRKE